MVHGQVAREFLNDRVAGEWKHLFRIVDSEGHTIDFLLRAKRGLCRRPVLSGARHRFAGGPEKITIDKWREHEQPGLPGCPDLILSYTPIGGNHLSNKRDEINTKSL